MRILLVHASDEGTGGGQIAMLRLQRGLRALGIDARILCRYPTRPDSSTIPSPSIERYIGAITRRIGLNDVHCVGSFRLLRTETIRAADVLDIHCIHSNIFSYLALPALTREKPTVLTLHDMWFITGHCGFSLECERWRLGCGACPHLDTPPAVRRDATRLEWMLKRWVYKRSCVVVVAPSAWMASLARQSLLGRFAIHHIPYGVDTEAYAPLDAGMCRHVLGIPPGKRVVLLSAFQLNDPRKGADRLIEALETLPRSLRSELVLLLVGHAAVRIPQFTDLAVVETGHVRSDRLKALCYAAADLLAFPTQADNLPLTLLESFACGTPAVAFRVGGVPEIVQPGLTGDLAEPGNASDLAARIVALLEDPPLLERMRQHCRALVLAQYRLDLQAHRYAELYQGVSAAPPAAPTGASGLAVTCDR